jgi:hypothetical protein
MSEQEQYVKLQCGVCGRTKEISKSNYDELRSRWQILLCNKRLANGEKCGGGYVRLMVCDTPAPNG